MSVPTIIGQQIVRQGYEGRPQEYPQQPPPGYAPAAPPYGAPLYAQPGYGPGQYGGGQYGHQQPQYAPYQPPPAGGGGYQPPPPIHGGSMGGFQPGGHHPSNFEMDHMGGVDDSGKYLNADTDISIRHGFVRKVYSILAVQLFITFGLALMFNLWDEAGVYILQHQWIFFVAMAVMFVLLIVLVCVPGVANKHPINLILLFFISLCFGVTLGYACARVSTSAFAIAAGITALVCVALSVFACQTKWDFTGCGAFVMVTALVLLVFGILCAIIRNHIMHMVYASIGALLFSFYLIYDTQQIVGGKHRKNQYSIDDYVFAALTLYMDIINLFSFILQIVASAQNN